MDYISEAERLKLYYKGLNEAGSAKHIAAAHPDMVSDNEEPDVILDLQENDDFKHILKEGLQAGTTAAIISFVLETAPELYKCIDKLIREGELDENDLKNVGLNALKGGAKGFVRGFVSA